MTRLIFWRLVQLPFLLMIIYTATFVLAWMIPGNPLEMDDARRPSPEIQEAMQAQYNLNDPWTFYWQYLSDALQGDFGPSLRAKDWRVSEIIGNALPVSLQLGLGAILLAVLLGVSTGVLGAVRRGGVWDNVTLAVALVGISLPTFVTGSVLLLLFTVNMGWPPVGWGNVSQVFLPALTLSLPFAAYIARLTRMGMIEVLNSDYVRTARAKGVPPGRVVRVHALKVAFLPVLSFLGPAAAAAMTGSFVVEKVFNIPGMGEHFVAAVINKDLFLIMGVVLVYATLLIMFNLLVDVAYHLVDPRIEQ